MYIYIYTLPWQPLFEPHFPGFSQKVIAMAIMHACMHACMANVLIITVNV